MSTSPNIDALRAGLVAYGKTLPPEEIPTFLDGIQALLQGGKRRNSHGRGAPHVTAKLASLGDYRREAVEWVCPMIPRRMFSVLFGEHGLGKGMYAAMLAAHLSHEDQRTIFVPFEDTAEHVLRPRLQALQANMSFIDIFRVEAEMEGHDGGRILIPRLSEHLDLLAELIEDSRAALVVIDPFVNFLDTGTDVNSDFKGVADAAAKLAQVADERDVAPLGVMHVNKGSGGAWYQRMLGSVAFGTTARSVIALGRNPAAPDSTDRIVAHAKCNLAELATSMKYRVEPFLLEATDEEPEVTTSYLSFAETSDIFANDLWASTEDTQLSKADRVGSRGNWHASVPLRSPRWP